MRRVFEPSVFYNNFGPYEPVLHLDDGDTLIVRIPGRRMDGVGMLET